MADTLFTIHLITTSGDFMARLNAGASQQNVPGDPVTWVWNNRYDIASAPSWAEKVDYWTLSNPPPDPPDPANPYDPFGWATDQSVISDADIISQIQFLMAQPASE